MSDREHCPLCGDIPFTATKRHPDDPTSLHCKLCGNHIRDIGHPALAA